MKRIGFLLPNLGNNQLAYEFIKSANRTVRDGDDVVGFYDSLFRPCAELGFSTMHSQEAWGFNGPLVATSLSSAAKLLDFPASRDKFFYIWDMEWIRSGRNDYHQLAYVYRNPSLRLIARSEHHVRPIKDAWGREPELVVNSLDVSKFLGLVK